MLRAPQNTEADILQLDVMKLIMGVSDAATAGGDSDDGD